MTGSDYGGESPAKKLARHSVWAQVWVANATRFRGMSFLVLAGPENADVRAIRVRGGDPQRIVCIDHDADVLEQARLIEPRATYMQSDALVAARSLRHSIDCVVLDYCAQLNETSMAAFARTIAWVAKERAVVIGAFSYGRESGRAAHSLQRADELFNPLDVEISMLLPSYEDEREFEVSHEASSRRFNHFLRLAAKAFTNVGLCYRVPEDPALASFAYISRTMHKVGTPMLYTIGSITRPRSRRLVGVEMAQATQHAQLPADVQEMNERVRSQAVMLARQYGSAVAAEAYNLSTPQVAAWLATANRQDRTWGREADAWAAREWLEDQLGPEFVMGHQ